MPPIVVYVVLGLGTLFGIFTKKPVPSTDYKFTTAETCPFYRDAYGQTQVEPFVICPDPEEQKLLAEWKRCGADCQEDGSMDALAEESAKATDEELKEKEEGLK